MKMLTLNDFNYDLPSELIAQHPAKKRTGSKLLVINRQQKTIEHRAFNDFINYIHKDDSLVVNDTYVIAARLKAIREKTDAKLEVFIEKKLSPYIYKVLIKPSKRAKEGEYIKFLKSALRAQIIEDLSPQKVIKFKRTANLENILEDEGAVPLPPYIKRPPVRADKLRYQTVYAQNKGAVAAPTAGLHFDKNYLNKLEHKGIKICQLTLHVSYGTFKPVTQDDLTKKRLHTEYFSLNKKTVTVLNRIKQSNGRVFAVGTTSCRAMESAVARDGFLRAQSRETDLFIYPPYRFRATDALLTNFHLPQSSLLMLVSAFMSDVDNLTVKEGHALLMEAYRQAVKEKYRFYSYGDAMLIL
jgi:S-adenosylmethionine:tRNA ribosyltransferase-isomerase